ncbi:hypothetical protein KEM55_005285 [Ascosphaera atra]|nr:hypothetical protein KEM55_005285 [Ascosphaera atra]
MDCRGLNMLRTSRGLSRTLFSRPATSTQRLQLRSRTLATTATPEQQTPTEAAAATAAKPKPKPTQSLKPPPPPSTLSLTNKPMPQVIKTRKGTVISAGKMDKTVRVRMNHLMFHKHLNKTFPDHTVYMVHDPNNSCREGDVVEFSNGWRMTRNVRHVVEKIVAPFGSRVEERPKVLSREEREAARAVKREAKVERRAKRGVKPHQGPYVGKIKSLVLQRMAQMPQREKELLGRL